MQLSFLAYLVLNRCICISLARFCFPQNLDRFIDVFFWQKLLLGIQEAYCLKAFLTLAVSKRTATFNVKLLTDSYLKQFLSI